MGNQLPLPKKGAEPLPQMCCGQTATWMKMPLGMEVGLCARWGSSSPSPRKGAQLDGWIKMPLGMDVGLDPSDIVLDGKPTPPS